MDVGPLGCIPFVRAIKLIPKGKCWAEVNTLIRGYNSKLKAELRRMNKEIGPETIFVYANTYDVFREIILNYRYFGKYKQLFNYTIKFIFSIDNLRLRN